MPLRQPSRKPSACRVMIRQRSASRKSEDTLPIHWRRSLKAGLWEPSSWIVSAGISKAKEHSSGPKLLTRQFQYVLPRIPSRPDLSFASVGFNLLGPKLMPDLG